MHRIIKLLRDIDAFKTIVDLSIKKIKDENSRLDEALAAINRAYNEIDIIIKEKRQ